MCTGQPRASEPQNRQVEACPAPPPISEDTDPLALGLPHCVGQNCWPGSYRVSRPELHQAFTVVTRNKPSMKVSLVDFRLA